MYQISIIHVSAEGQHLGCFHHWIFKTADSNLGRDPSFFLAVPIQHLDHLYHNFRKSIHVPCQVLFILLFSTFPKAESIFLLMPSFILSLTVRSFCASVFICSLWQRFRYRCFEQTVPMNMERQRQHLIHHG